MKTILEKTDKYEVALVTDYMGKTLGKLLRSPEYNYNFNYETGEMLSWGKTTSDLPEMAPAPDILDMEVTTRCKHGCLFCYKSNTLHGKNMSFETFKEILNVLPKTITQIAFGADYDLTSNPDLWKMMEYARFNQIVPNITLGYCDDATADKLALYCGACAVSRYEDKDKCYDSIKRLTDRGMTQANIHLMVAEETFDKAIETINDAATDPRLKHLNAIVLLSLKQKGRGVGFNPLSDEKFKQLIDLAVEKKVGIGMDSCSSLKTLRALGKGVEKYVFPCEATLESSYINVDGEYFPCSFCEGSAKNWMKGLNVLECKNSRDFVDKIWNNPKTQEFRETLRATAGCNEYDCRTCPVFNV